ncbi:Pentatricopeptide repeat-containing protein At2g13600 [Linum perenne]
MISGYAQRDKFADALALFQDMMKECGILPNEITFLAVLGACRHMGLVDEGRRHFDSMVEDHGIKPTVKHYGCMVDLLGRAGKLREAEELIDSMPMAPDVSTWGALLGACTKYEDNVMGERVGRKLIEFQPDHDGFHVLLSNIYASRGDWNDAHEVRGTMRKHRVVKMPGCSMIEANGIVHEFSTPSD